MKSLIYLMEYRSFRAAQLKCIPSYRLKVTSSVSLLPVNLQAADVLVSSHSRLTLWGNAKKLYFHCWIFINVILVYLGAMQIFEVRGLFNENIAAAARRSLG